MASKAPPLRRNLRLLLQSSWEHLVDDPALLAVQISRRLPLTVRTRIGTLLRDVGAKLPDGAVEALGAVMAGEPRRAEEALSQNTQAGTRLHSAVAVMQGRPDLVPTDAPALSRARAAWAQGDLSAAVEILETVGEGASRYARRLRAELAMLRPGYRLPALPARPRGGAARRGGPSDPPYGAPVAPHAQAPRRVLHLLTNSLPHTQSGYSLRTHRILRALRETGITSVALTRTGYPVMVGVPHARDEDVVDGIRYLRSLPARLGTTQIERHVQEVEQALAIVEEERPQLLHATTPYQNALVAQAVSDITGIPWVYEVRGLAEQTWIASQAGQAAQERAAQAEKARLIAARDADLARAADAVVTLTASMAAELAERGVDPESITVVPNGVEDTLLERGADTRAARAEVAPQLQGAFAIGAVSALVDYEGFDVLLEAAAQLIHDGTAPAALRERLHVVLAGDGTHAPRLRALAADLGIADRLILPGRVDRDAAPRWVESLDVVVIPRRDRAVTRRVAPQKPIEAMALGRPVIASDLPPLREVLDAGDGTFGGILIPSGDAPRLAAEIQRLHGDPAARTELVARGRSLAAQRTWRALVTRYQHVYARAARAHEEGSARGE